MTIKEININTGENAEKRQTCTHDKNANLTSHYGKKYGESSKN